MSYLLKNIKKYFITLSLLSFFIALSSCEFYYKYQIHKQINEIQNLENQFSSKTYANKQTYQKIVAQYNLQTCVMLHNKTSRILTQSIFSEQNKYKNYCILTDNIIQILQTPSYNSNYKIAITSNTNSSSYYYLHSLKYNTFVSSKNLSYLPSIDNFYNKYLTPENINEDNKETSVAVYLDNDNLLKNEKINSYFIILNDQTPTNAFLKSTILQLNGIVELIDTKKTSYLYSFKNLKDDLGDDFIEDYLLIKRKIGYLFMIYGINYYDYKK